MDDNSFLESLGLLVSRIDEITSPIKKNLKRFGEIISPVLESLNKWAISIEPTMRKLSIVFRPIAAIQKLGENQFLFWDFLSDEFVDNILSQNNIKPIMRKYYYANDNRIVRATIEKIQACSKLTSQVLFSQSVEAFNNKQYNLAVVGLTSVFDGALANVSGMTDTNINKRLDPIIKKFEEKDVIDNQEYAIFALLITFQKTMEKFTSHSDFTHKEPTYLNRHWIMHGRSQKRRTKIDCIRLINIICGLILIDQLVNEENSAL